MNFLDLASILMLSLAVGAAVVLTGPLHHHWSGDKAGSGVQKHHDGSPPRVGALPILAGCALGYYVAGGVLTPGEHNTLGIFLLCCLPAAFIGLLEDVTKAVRARWRLLFPALGAAASAYTIGILIPPVGVPGLDVLLSWAPFALGLTIFMVVGFTHAMNIVDGLNGLSSGIGILMMIATAMAAHGAGDAMIFNAALIVALSIGGFFVLNFPRGLIFLGDGGAYFIGFVAAQLWILFLVRNPGEISPWFVLAVAWHPTIETAFSIVRRKLRVRRRPATAPDRLHLHSLLLRRQVRLIFGRSLKTLGNWASNSVASAILLLFASWPIFLACMFPSLALWNFAVMFFAWAGYLVAFRRLTRFKRVLPGRSSQTHPCAEAQVNKYGT